LPVSFDFLNLIESGSIKAELKVDGSNTIEFGLSRGNIRVHIEDLDFVKLILKITKFLRSELAIMKIETRKIGLLEGLKLFKGIAKDLAASNQTVTVVYEEKEILKIGEDAKPLITGIFLRHVAVTNKIKALILFRNLI
jgi:hypothetical protein